MQLADVPIDEPDLGRARASDLRMTEIVADGDLPGQDSASKKVRVPRWP